MRRSPRMSCSAVCECGPSPSSAPNSRTTTMARSHSAAPAWHFSRMMNPDSCQYLLLAPFTDQPLNHVELMTDHDFVVLQDHVTFRTRGASSLCLLESAQILEQHISERD